MTFNPFFKINSAALAAVIFAGATMSFKIVEKKSTDKQFYYNSTDTSEGAFSEVANWQEGTSPSCIAFGDRPCSMTVPEGNNLSDVIDGLTNAQVLAIHPSERRP